MMVQSILAWEICITLLHAVSIGCTFVRLIRRWRINRMWWDDYLVCIPLLADGMFLTNLWLRFRDGAISTPKYQSALYSTWLATFLFSTIIWISRISMTLSIARIFPQGHRCRWFALGLVIIFLIVYITGFLLATFTCGLSSSNWDLMIKLKNCSTRRSGSSIGSLNTIAPFYITAGFSADAALIVSPLVMLWKVKLPPKERRLVLALFSCSIFTVLSAIPFAVIWYFGTALSPDDRLILLTMTPMVEAAVGLLVCNLTIVTMLFYRMLNRKSPTHESPSAMPSQAHSADEHKTSTKSESCLPCRDTRSRPADKTRTTMVLTSVYDSENMLTSASLRSDDFDSRPFSLRGENSDSRIQSPIASWTFSERSTRDSS
ncbi:hypothetical protein B0H34DRAFT_378652 [Crassisporium funariophilum]|nr:hypothetical protein B0H34DRAFT_378652 [Crassisporium funariophilum]